MPTVIKLKTGTSTPGTSDITSGEVAVDTSAQKFYINDSGTIKEIGGTSSKITTTSTGITIEGSNTTGSIVEGDFRFKTDSGGSTRILWDASEGEMRFTDDYKAAFGTGGDLEIYHDGTNNEIRSSGAKDIYIRPKDTDVGVKVAADAAVELYYDNGKKLETTSTGATITGLMTATTIDGAAGDNLSLDFGSVA